ncbi:hypothetical protein CVV67_17865 [Arthrobacter stackebrandtii]|nr:hypothetical protein CVV67_17865 [Arthrobacter stackebrandtii]
MPGRLAGHRPIMNFPIFRALSLVCAVAALPGMWFIALEGNMGVGMPWIAAANALLGVVQAFRLYPMTLDGSGGSFGARAQGIDLAWASALQVAAALLLGLLSLLGGGGGAALWLPLQVLAMVVLGFLLGLLAGLLVPVPLATAVGAIAGRGGASAEALLFSAILVSLAAVGVLGTLAVDMESPGRGRGWLLIMLVAGMPVDNSAVTSAPLMWGARAAALLMVAATVALVRFQGGRRKSRREGRNPAIRRRASGKG